jgi:hypothetical protein
MVEVEGEDENTHKKLKSTQKHLIPKGAWLSRGSK